MVLHQHLFKLLSKFWHKQLLPFFNGEFWWCRFQILLIQFLYQLWCRLSFRYHFGSKYLGDHSTSLEVYRFAREITKHYGHTPATVPNFRVHWYHINTYQEIHLVLNIVCAGPSAILLGWCPSRTHSVPGLPSLL